MTTKKTFKHFQRWILCWVSMAITGLFLNIACAHADDLTFYTDENPPINFTKNGKVTGIANEVVMEIQRRINDHAPIIVTPWARGYQTALGRGVVGLYPMVRIKEREHLFKWVGPVFNVSTSFYALHDSPLQIHSLSEAKALPPILVPRLYYFQQYLSSQGFNNLDMVDGPEVLMHMFIAGRRPVMVIDNLTLGPLLERNGATKQDVRTLYTFLKSQSYIAFSIDTPDAVVQRWQNTLNELKRDGTFAKLYQTWLPGETPPGLYPDPVQ
jgi:polar amino acid transport system substrate-binding protein